MFRRIGLALLTVVVSSGLLLGGQQPPVAPGNQTPADPQPPQQPIFRARVELVRVDVSVTGRDDEPVSDLKPEDFELTEDDIPQKVETVDFVRLDGRPRPGDNEALEIRSPSHAAVEAAKEDVRLFAIFLDDYHVDKHPQIMVPLRRALEQFVKQFAATDLVAVMDPLTPLSHLEFTRDRQKLLERVQKFEGRRGELFPVRSAAEEAQMKERNVWELRGGVSLSALHALVTHLGGLREGRKSVLYVSQGPAASRIGSLNEHRVRDVIRAANTGNVTIHVLDPRPLGMSPFGGELTLRRFTDETGGRAIVNTNDPSTGLSQVIADASAYYLVGYTPTRTHNDGKFHKIDVKVKRRGVRVTSRQGYWSPSQEELNPEIKPGPAPEVVDALSNLVEPVDGRALDIWVGAARGTGDLTRLTITWDATGRFGTTPPAQVEVQPADVVTGEAIAPAQTIVSGLGKPEPAAATFEVEPGPLSLRFTARAANGSVIDQWPERVRVPSLAGEVAIATPRFLRARTAFEQRIIQQNANAPPAASRRLSKTDRVLIEVEAYGPPGQPLDMTMELLNKEGSALLPMPVPPLQDGKARVTLPLYSIAPGTYLLRLEAKSGEKQARQIVSFQVVP